MTSVCPAGVTFLLLLLILLDRLLLVILELVRCVSCQFPCRTHNDLPGCRLGTAAGYYGLGGHQGGAHCLIFSTFCKMMSESPQRIETLPEVIIRFGGSCCRPERGWEWEMPTINAWWEDSLQWLDTSYITVKHSFPLILSNKSK